MVAAQLGSWSLKMLFDHSAKCWGSRVTDDVKLRQTLTAMVGGVNGNQELPSLSSHYNRYLEQDTELLRVHFSLNFHPQFFFA